MMEFRKPISTEQLAKLDRESFNAAVELADEIKKMKRDPLKWGAKAVWDFRFAYEEYRLDGSQERADGKDDQAELSKLADKVRDELGPKFGDEAIRAIVKAIDEAIGKSLGDKIR